MRVRALTSNYDYAFGQSAQNFLVDSPAAVAQIVETSLNLFLGEWYLDQTIGMPWREGVIGKWPQATADLTVQTYIANIPNVSSIENYESVDTQSDRSYKSTCTINTPFGTTDIAVEQEV